MSRLSSLFRRPSLRSFALVLGLFAPLTLTASGCASNLNMTEITAPEGGVSLGYALTPGSIFLGSISSKRSDGSVGGNQSTRKLDLKAKLTVMGARGDGATQVNVEITDIVVSWVVPNAPMDLDAFTDNAKKKLKGMKIDMFLADNGDIIEFPDPPADLPQEDQFLMELVLDGLEQAFYAVPRSALTKGDSWDDEKERGRKGKLGRYYKETTKTHYKGLYKPDNNDKRVAYLDIDGERIETITTKEGGHETKYVDEKTVTFDIDSQFLASMTGKRTKYDGDQVSRIEFRANWEPTGEAAVAKTVKQKINDPCSDDYVGGDDCTDACSSNYMGDEACKPEGEAPAEGGEAPAEGGEAPAEGDEAPAEGADTGAEAADPAEAPAG